MQLFSVEIMIVTLWQVLVHFLLKVILLGIKKKEDISQGVPSGVLCRSPSPPITTVIIRLKRQYLISNVEHSLFLLQVVCSECNYISATKAEALFQRYA